MAGELQPLDQKFAIVDERGNPTDYFIRWSQQKQIDIGTAITLADLQTYLTEHSLQEGSGIQFTPDGDLNNSPTIAADVQEILDQISTTRGAVIYRGAGGWAALAPGTSGDFLKTNGAGADPAWATPAGGGGGITKIGTVTVAGAAAASISFTGIANTYLDLFWTARLRSTDAAVAVNLLTRFNNDATAIYDSAIIAVANNVVSGTNFIAQTSLQSAAIPGAGSLNANKFAAIKGEIIQYANTSMEKIQLTDAYDDASNTAATGRGQRWGGNWRSTAAINRLDFLLSAGNLAIGSTITLYGRS